MGEREGALLSLRLQLHWPRPKAALQCRGSCEAPPVLQKPLFRHAVRFIGLEVPWPRFGGSLCETADGT